LANERQSRLSLHAAMSTFAVPARAQEPRMASINCSTVL
jgi:hypothetical protein